MPTYQYACRSADCGNRFELVQSFSDPAATECPVCGNSVRKVFSAVGVVFKGSGFYRTDSRSGSGKSETSSASSKPKEAAAASSSSADSSSSASSSSTSSSSSSSSGSTGSSSTRAAASA